MQVRTFAEIGIATALLVSCACDTDEAIACETAADCDVDQRCADGACLKGSAGEGEGEGEVPVDCSSALAVQLTYEVDHFDLDSGSIEQQVGFEPPNDRWDVKIAFNATRTPPGVVFQNQVTGTELVHVDVGLCDTIGLELETLPFQTALIDIAFVLTVLVRTSAGSVFAMGDPADFGSSQQFWLLQLK